MEGIFFIGTSQCNIGFHNASILSIQNEWETAISNWIADIGLHFDRHWWSSMHVYAFIGNFQQDLK